MKKISILAITLISIVTLSACSVHSKKAALKKASTVTPTKKVKLANQKNQTQLITKKGTITFYKSYRGRSYDKHTKKHSNMIMYSFKATNKTNKMITAGQIVNNTKLVMMAKVHGKTKMFTEPLAYSSAYTNKHFNQQAKLNTFDESWNNEPIKPHQTITITSVDAFPLLKNKSNNQWLRVVRQDDYTKNSVIDKKYNQLNLTRIHAKNVKKPVDIIK